MIAGIVLVSKAKIVLIKLPIALEAPPHVRHLFSPKAHVLRPETPEEEVGTHSSNKQWLSVKTPQEYICNAFHLDRITNRSLSSMHLHIRCIFEI
jgi:hypothetical protein